MPTNKIIVTEGVGLNLASHSFTEDALTKHVSRVVLNNSSGVNIDSLTANSVVSIKTAQSATDFIASASNSSSAQLAASATFTGAVENVYNQTSCSILVRSDQPGTLTILQYIDAGGTQLISTRAYTHLANAPIAMSRVLNGNYMKITYQNTGASTTTTFIVDTAFGTIDSTTDLGNTPMALMEVGGTAMTASTAFADAENNTQPALPTEAYNMAFNGTTWDRMRGTITNGLAVDVTRIAGKQTFKASTIIPLVTAVTVNVPFFNIIGSASKTVSVKKISINGHTLTAVAYTTINVEKLSTASSGGTSTTLTAVSLDSNNAVATAVVKAYTVAPTKGTLVGTISSQRILSQATVAVAAGITTDFEFKYGDFSASNPVVLRGVAQEICLTYPVVLATAGTCAIDIEWTEE